MKSIELLTAVVIGIGTFALGGPPPGVEQGVKDAKSPPAVPAAEATRLERWKLFREHIEKMGKKDLLPEEEAGAKAPTTDAIIGILFRISPEIAAAHDLLDQESPDVAGARARLAKLDGSQDPYIADYQKLLGARCDLLEKNYAVSVRGFEGILNSNRNLAGPAAHRGLAECYRGLDETTMEVLELRFMIAGLPPGSSADRSFADARLAEIRLDHPGPLQDSRKRMGALSERLAKADSLEGVAPEQAKVEDILIKVAKLLEAEAKRCPLCMSMECKPCKKCGACTTTGMCQGEHTGPGKGMAKGKGQGKGEKGDPKGAGKGKAADRSQIAKGENGQKKLRESTGKDSDAWGSVNDREVAKALQDLWGKIPPGYRRTVSEYFKDISGLETSKPSSEK
jgi:hypothetical protein